MKKTLLSIVLPAQDYVNHRYMTLRAFYDLLKTPLFYLRGAWLWQDPGDGSCHDILPKTSVLFNLEETQVRESGEDSESSLKSG